MADAVSSYFRDQVRDMMDHVVDIFETENILQETAEWEEVPGGEFIARTLGGIDTVNDIFKHLLGACLEGVLDQNEIVQACIEETEEGEVPDDDTMEAYADRFIADAMTPLTRLDESSREAVEMVMRNQFPIIVRQTVYFRQLEGDTFEEKLQQLPRDEAEERLAHTLLYIDRLKDVIAEQDTVCIQEDLFPVRIHIKQETLRLLDEASSFMHERIEETLSDAYD